MLSFINLNIRPQPVRTIAQWRGVKNIGVQNGRAAYERVVVCIVGGRRRHGDWPQGQHVGSGTGGGCMRSHHGRRGRRAAGARPAATAKRTLTTAARRNQHQHNFNQRTIGTRGHYS